MRILLPPSEAKESGGIPPERVNSPDNRPPLGATGGPPHPVPHLVTARGRVRDALSELLATSDAASVLGLPTRSATSDLAANALAAVGTALVRPALERYAGVVYAGLAAGSLGPGARRRAAESVLIFSGLLGVVRGDEPVPLYRLPVAAQLPGLGVLTTFWRPVLADVVPDLLDGAVIDLRSTDYAAMWRPERCAAVITVRILSARAGRSPGVISHPSKLGKGRLTRALLTARREPRGPADVVAAWRRAGGRDGTAVGTAVELLV